MTPEASRNQLDRTLTMLVVAALAVAAGVSVGYAIAVRFPKQTTGAEPKNTDEPAPRDRITAPGRLQPEGGVVSMYGPTGDRIAKLYPLAPGTYLKADDPIAELAWRQDRLLELQIAETQLAETKAARNAAVRAAKTKLRATETELDRVRANKANDLAALDAKLAYLKLQAEGAAKQVIRLRELKDKNAMVADEDIERAELLRAQADAELTAARAAREKTATASEGAERVAQAQIAVAVTDLDAALVRAPVESAEERLELARRAADLTIIRAPVSGFVLKVLGRTGQPTGIEPILQMAGLTQMTAVAEVSESDVAQLTGWVKAGPVPVEVTSPALTKPLKGTMRSEADIARIVARNQASPPGPRENAERRTVEVVVHLDDASTAEAGRLVGLQVTVTFAQK